MYREVAAFILDNGFSGVPPTALAKVRHRFLRNENMNTLHSMNSFNNLYSSVIGSSGGGNGSGCGSAGNGCGSNSAGGNGSGNGGGGLIDGESERSTNIGMRSSLLNCDTLCDTFTPGSGLRSGPGSVGGSMSGGLGLGSPTGGGLGSGMGSGLESGMGSVGRLGSMSGGGLGSMSGGMMGSVLGSGMGSVGGSMSAGLGSVGCGSGSGDGLENFYGGYKLSSVQSYVRHEGCADDMGPGLFDEDDICRIAVLDIRLCNLDRHGGNILICSHQPYVRAPYRCQSSQISPSLSSLSSRIYGCVEEDRERDKFRGSREKEKEWSRDGRERGERGRERDSLSPCLSPCVQFNEHDMLATSAPNLSTSLDLFYNRCQTPPRVSNPHTPVPHSPNVWARSGTPKTVSKHRLVPIDHGYCLPHILHMSDTAFIWLNWSCVRGKKNREKEQEFVGRS